MNILSISHLSLVPYDPPSGYGGKAFHKPTEALVSYGCDVHVVSPVPFSPFPIKNLSKKWKKYSVVPKFENINSVCVFHPRYISFPRSLFMSLSGLLMYYSMKHLTRTIYDGKRFDVIHAHNVYPDGYAGLLCSRRFNKPLVVTARATDVDITSNINSFYFRVIKKVLDDATRVVVPSPRLYKAVESKFGIQANVICNGIDVDEINSYIKKQNQRIHYGGKIVIMSVCQLIKSKGIDLNLLAIKSLISKCNHLYYIIIGDGPERSNLEKLSFDLGLVKVVKFMGTLTHSETIQYIDCCEIFSMPSWQETFGLVYLEAMALGKPIIGCKGQGMDTIISDEKIGMLTEPKDWKSVAFAMDYLLNNPTEVKEMGLRGSKLIVKEFTHTRHAEKIFELYKSIVGQI